MYDQIKNSVFSAIRNNIELSVDVPKNFADKKNHIIMSIHAQNNQYDVTRLFTLPFKDISHILYTSIQTKRTSGISPIYHNHIA